MRHWLITGASGFIGSHVRELLMQRLDGSVRVSCLTRRLAAGRGNGWILGSLDDAGSLARVLAEVAPDVVVHAAGRTPPAAPAALYAANTGGTANLVRALAECGRPVRLVVAGSAAELGPVPEDELPVDESHACRPADPYGLSKWFAAKLALLAPRPIEPIVARVFNPIGPGLPPTQAFGGFAAVLAAVGPDPVHLTVGDLDARRDFVDVRDVARALVALGESGEPGTLYHVGTGRSRPVCEGLDGLIALSGRRVVLRHRAGIGRAGPSDSRADTARLRAATGWEPVIPWEDSLRDLWEEARRAALRRVA